MFAVRSRWKGIAETEQVLPHAPVSTKPHQRSTAARQSAGQAATKAAREADCAEAESLVRPDGRLWRPTQLPPRPMPQRSARAT
jgi:hypothetical protein